MLFNSYVFIVGFLPLTLLGFAIAGRFKRNAVVGWLGFMSLMFYAHWKPAMLAVLLVSIALNYLAAVLIARNAARTEHTRRLLWAALALNLVGLGYFKYLFPALNFAANLLHGSHSLGNVILPLGISFFTFTQIAYLVDLQQGIAEIQDPLSYLLFVTFFPHLIAGPILHHKEMVPQWTQERVYKLNLEDLAVGMSWFIFGLCKKVVADYFARTADLAFNSADWHMGSFAAQRAIITYTLQLYFDFSGYSDMALGLARMFSIDFPLNFSSPFKARNITEFWQRWHMTLTRYINAYLYSPIQFAVSKKRLDAGKKVSKKAQATLEGFTNMVAMPTLLTMFIAGIWHGAGLTFMVFGLLHGIYLAVHQAWRTYRHAKGLQPVSSVGGRRLAHASSVLLTFVCVLVATTFFRAESLSQGAGLLLSAAGIHGFHAKLPGESSSAFLGSMSLMIGGLVAIWAMPNTQQILSRFKPSLELTTWDTETLPKRLVWRPTVPWAVVLSVLLMAVLMSLQNPSAFLYFQF